MSEESENENGPDLQAADGGQPQKGRNLDHPNLVRMRERLANKNRTGRQRCKLMLYDPEAQTYLDRTCSEWGKLL